MAFNRFRDDFKRFPRQMHKIKCSECGKEAEVPFMPKEGLPVYCRECFMKRKGITPRESEEKEEKPRKKKEAEEDIEEAEEVEEAEEDME